MEANEIEGWIAIIYKVPSNPSTARVTIWKKTKELGALPLQQSVYILPKLPELKSTLNQLKKQIQKFGGECRILEIASLEKTQEQEIIDGFNNLRKEEYEEIIEECEAFLQEIEKETKVEKFYYSEVEEIEKRLEGLKDWFAIVVKRDFFGVGIRDKVADILKECEDKFNGFSQKVFSREETIAQDSRFSLPTLKLQEEAREEPQNTRTVYSRAQLLARLKEITDKLENKSFKFVEGPRVILPETVAMELKYKDRRGLKSLGIEIKWRDSEIEPQS